MPAARAWQAGHRLRRRPRALATFGGEGLPTLLELGTDPMTRIGESVWVARIAPLLWLHTTTATIEGGYVFPANGLIVERSKGSLLIRTGYSPDQSSLLLQWSNINLASPISSAIATHFHPRPHGGHRRGCRPPHPHDGFSADLRACEEAHTLPLPEPIRDFTEKPYRFAADCGYFFPAQATRARQHRRVAAEASNSVRGMLPEILDKQRPRQCRGSRHSGLAGQRAPRARPISAGKDRDPGPRLDCR